MFTEDSLVARLARVATLGSSDDAEDEDLEANKGAKKSTSTDGDTEDLDMKHDDTAPSRLGEAGPGVSDAGIARSADDSRLNPAVKGAVEGDDGVLVCGEERGLDTDENNPGGDEQDHLAKDKDEAGKEDPDGKVEGVADPVDVEGVDKETAEGKGSLTSRPEDESRPPGSLEGGLEGGKTGPEASGRLRGDDLVNPGGSELDEGDGADKATDEDADAVGKAEREGANDEAAEDALDDEAGKATEAGAEAAVRSDQAEGSAEGRGDGPAVSTGASDVDSRSGGGGDLGAVAVGEGLNGEGLVGGRLVILDHGKEGEDLAKGVVNEEDGGDKDNVVEDDDDVFPRQLRRLWAVVAGDMAALPEHSSYVVDHDGG